MHTNTTNLKNNCNITDIKLAEEMAYAEAPHREFAANFKEMNSLGLATIALQQAENASNIAKNTYESTPTEMEIFIERKKAAIDYIAGLTKEKEQILRNQDPTKDMSPKELYKCVASKIDWVDHFLTSSTPGIAVVKDISKPNLVVELGWAEYHPFSEDHARNITWILTPNEVGRQTADKLRDIQGFVTTKDQNRINRQRWETAVYGD